MSRWPIDKEMNPNFNNQGWVGVDLDGTLAHYTEWKGIDQIGPPIPRTLNLVRALLDKGIKVKIFTARVGPQRGGAQEAVHAVQAIRAWCMRHLGQELAITNEKDLSMIWMIDDRCSQVVRNSGLILAPEHACPEIINLDDFDPSI
jgi:hypothetical protein